MKFRKLLFAIPAIVLSTSSLTGMFTTSCSSVNLNEKKSVKVLDDQGKEMFTTNLYYENGSSIALIGLKDGFQLVEKMHAKFVSDDKIKFTITSDGTTKTITRENGATCVVNPFYKTFTFNDFTAFVAEGTSRTSDLIRDYGGYKHYKEQDVKFIAYGDRDVRVKPNPTTVFNLSAYQIQMFNQNNEIYIPLQTLSDMFLADCGHPVCALKDAIAISDAMGYCKGGKLPTYPDFIKNNALTITSDLLEFNYKETCFYLDHFYGLIDNKWIDTFDTLFKSNSIIVDGKSKTLKECMLTSVELADEALNWVIGYICDDGHTVYLNRSPSNKDTTTLSRYEGVNETFLNDERARYNALRNQAYPSGVKKYELSQIDAANDTAIIRFDNFEAIPNDFSASQIPTDPNDAQNAIQLFASAYKKVADSSSTIKNWVVDLSCNGGGDARFLTWLASTLVGGEIEIPHSYTSDNSINVCSYYADCNFDGVIDNKDWVLKDKNVYVLTSAFSFSCANLLPTLTFNKPNTKVIGKTSGGGACVVSPSINVFGTAYQISGAFQLGHIKNGQFYTNDSGIEPSFFVPDTKYYDNAGLCSYIKNHQ